MTRFLIYSTFLSIFFLSCRGYQYPEAVGTRPANMIEVNTYFLDTTDAVVYRAKIEAFSKPINGSLIIKTITPDSHRVALVNDFGQTLFDVSVFPNKYIPHYVMVDLDNKLVVREIVNIFRTMTERRFANSALIFMDKQHYPVYVVDNTYYRVKENMVDNITQVNRTTEEVIINFTSSKGDIPAQIDIEHKKFSLTMNLVLDQEQK